MTTRAEAPNAVPSDAVPADGIAIVGLAGRFPGARDVGEFWANLRGGVESIVALGEEELRAAGVGPQVWGRAGYVRAAPRFEGMDRFDAEFFGYSAREAQLMDPQHRLFLETAWHALEHAGHDPAQFDGRVGVFAGAGSNRYQARLYTDPSIVETYGLTQVLVANELGFLSTRVSYKLDLRGPSVSLRTACSTSLVAVHTARHSLLAGECDMALAGGVYLDAQQNAGYQHTDGSFVSPDGRVRPFDAEARGTVFGSGVGVVVLRRLADALADGDTVWAVVRGSAVNNDGADKVSFTAPSVSGQAAAVADALRSAGLRPSDIDYVEAHGTGTALGDPIEVQALSRVFAGVASGSCGLGSLKGNVGHLDAAAGMAGLVKVVGALAEGVVPASLNVSRVSPQVAVAGSPFRVCVEPMAWPRVAGRPRRAGVSAFGFGGTNAHVVVEEPPPARGSGVSGRDGELLVVSARSAEALERVSDRLAGYLRTVPGGDAARLADVAFTLAVGRRALPFRRVVSGAEPAAVAAALAARDPAVVADGRVSRDAPPVVFLFAGQGAQHVGMAGGLYAGEPVFRAAVDRCAQAAGEVLEGDLRSVLLAEPDDPAAAAALAGTGWAQPAVFTVEYALARLWQSWGVAPAAMVGHSVGEYVAACLAGVLAERDAVRLVTARGRLMAGLPGGAMLAVLAAADEVAAVLPAGVTVAARNTARECVVSGPVPAVEQVAALAGERGWVTRRLATSHAFHSAMMDPILDQLRALVTAVDLAAPTLPYVSTLTGQWVTAEQVSDPGYWTRHTREPVRYADALATLAATHPAPILLDLSPGRALSALTRRAYPQPDPAERGSTDPTGQPQPLHLASLPAPGEDRTDTTTVRTTLGRLWLTGLHPDWTGYYTGQTRTRIPLPTYPFTPTSHWLDIAPADAPGTPGGAPGDRADAAADQPHPLVDRIVLRSYDQLVAETDFATDRHWVLAEHRLLGAAIVPGTTYLEMATAAAAEHFGRPATCLRDVAFFVPLLVPDGEQVTVRVTLRETGDDRAEFTVASARGGPAAAADQRRRWTVHARGVVGGSAVAVAPDVDVAALRARCAGATVDTEAMQAEHRVMRFGDRWRSSLRRVHVGNRVALGELDLPERYRGECAELRLHPALLDLATGFSSLAVLDDPDGDPIGRDRDLFLPVGYDEVEIYRPLPPRGVSVIEPQPGFAGHGEARKVDVLVCDDDGRPALRVRGFTTKRVRDPEVTVEQLRSAPRHYRLRWEPAGEPTPGELSTTVALVGAASPLATALDASLRGCGVSVTRVVLGEGADAAPPTAHGLDEAASALDGVDELVFVADAPGDAGLDYGAHALFHLVKSRSARGGLPGRLAIVARSATRVTGDESRAHPEHAALLGLARVVAQEYDGTSLRCVDVDDRTAPERIVGELADRSAPSAVALRDGRRYHSALTALELTGGRPLPASTYLVTGGLGGLGLAVARHLARTVPGARIALTGRTALPPPEAWDAVAAGTRQAAQIRAVRELQDAGADVRVLAADVTDERRMREVVADVRAAWGHVSCVVHAAGVAGDGFLFRKDFGTFARTMAPKVAGAAVLDRVTEDDPPDLMVAFGSTVSVFGAAGQGDYTAANAYLDAFAAERTARGRRTVTIRWSDWLEVGMAHDHEVAEHQGFFRSVTPTEALASFDAICAAAGDDSADVTDVIVGEVNLPRLATMGADAVAALLDSAPIVVSGPLRAGIADAVRAAGQGEERDERAAPAGGPEPALIGRDDGAYTDAERAVAGLWARELGLDSLNVHESSFELGGDSLTALRIAQSIEKVMDVRVSMMDLFRYETVAELAAFLDEQRAATASGS